MAAVAQQGLLGAADAVSDAKGPGPTQHFRGPFVGENLYLNGDALLNGDDPQERWLVKQGLAQGLVVIVLEHLGKLFVYAAQLFFVDADGEGQQSEFELAFVPLGVDEPFADHRF